MRVNGGKPVYMNVVVSLSIYTYMRKAKYLRMGMMMMLGSNMRRAFSYNTHFLPKKEANGENDN